MTQKLTPEERQQRASEATEIRQQKSNERAKERLLIKMEKDEAKAKYNQMIQNLLKQNPIYYDTNRIYWSWDWSKRCYNIVDDITIMNKLTQLTGLVITKSDEKTEFLETVRQAGRLSNPKELPVNYIQFKDCVIDINTGDKFQADPEYMYTNSISHNLGSCESTPIMDKLFGEWVGKAHIISLYEIMAYCMYNDYPIHLYFVLYGIGRNGKSQFTKLLERFLNKDNTCTTDLDKLGSSAFESAKLYKKQVCFVNETDGGVMKKESTLKRLTGNDSTSFEFKGKDAFDAHNYAKIIISTNNLPKSNDTSDGFYSRFVKVGFTNQFIDDNNKMDIIDTIPNKEYENLGFKLVRILKELLNRGKFTENKSIKQKCLEYQKLSEPVKYYLDLNYEYNDNNKIKIVNFIFGFNEWLINTKINKVSNKKIFNDIRDMGFEIERQTVNKGKIQYILNITKKEIIFYDPDVNPFDNPIPEQYQ